MAALEFFVTLSYGGGSCVAEADCGKGIDPLVALASHRNAHIDGAIGRGTDCKNVGHRNAYHIRITRIVCSSGFRFEPEWAVIRELTTRGL